jgi:hypothetical protein
MTFSHMLAAVLVAGLMAACADTPTAPTAHTISPPPASPTTAAPPQIPVGPPVYTLSGVVSETSAAGEVPVGDALVEVGVCAPSRLSAPARVITAHTDVTGAYRVSGVCSGTAAVWVTKAGYKTQPPEQCDGDCLIVPIEAQDTQFNVQLYARRDAAR